VGLALNLIVTVVFVAVQWRIAAILLREAARLFSGWALTAARGTVFLFDALLLAGYSFSFSELIPHLGIPGHIALIMGAGILAYLITATAALAVYLAFKAIAKQLGADVNPGRRRALNAAGNVLMAAPFVVMGYGAMVERLDFRCGNWTCRCPACRWISTACASCSSATSTSAPSSTSPIWQGSSTWPSICGRTSPWSPGTSSRLAATPWMPAYASSPASRADAGTFGCMGNHEHYAGVERYTAEAGARAGIRFLRGQAQTLRFGNSVLNLAGVDYQSLADRGHYLRGTGAPGRPRRRERAALAQSRRVSRGGPAGI
jgi:hypothetical protein